MEWLVVIQRLSSTLAPLNLDTDLILVMKVMGFSIRSRSVTRCKRTFVGCWLAALYVMCVSLVVYSLSTYQFQIKLSSIPQISVKKDSFVEHLCDVTDFSAEAREQASGQENKKALLTLPCLPKKVTSKEHFYSTGEVLAIYKKLNELMPAEITLAQQLEKDLKKKQYQLEQELALSPDNSELKKDLAFVEGNIRNANINLKTLHENRRQYILEHKTLIDTFSDIEYFEKFFESFSSILGISSFWALPRSILTLILVLSTGILGSLIFVTVEFLKEPENHIKSLSMYLLRPFLGMILALSIYVMLKSGQFTFFDNTSGQLSPFVISFLGIISGMLAEQAYHRMAETGKTVLNGESSKIDSHKTSKKE